MGTDIHTFFPLFIYDDFRQMSSYMPNLHTLKCFHISIHYIFIHVFIYIQYYEYIYNNLSLFLLCQNNNLLVFSLFYLHPFKKSPHIFFNNFQIITFLSFLLKNCYFSIYCINITLLVFYEIFYVFFKSTHA